MSAVWNLFIGSIIFVFVEGLGQIASVLLDLVFPRHCCSCGGAVEEEMPGALCWDCRSASIQIEPPLCDRCGMPVAGRVDHAFTCSSCANDAPAFDQGRSLFRYEGPVRDGIHALKYHKNLAVVPNLAEWVRAGLMSSFTEFPDETLLVPVPLHPKRKRKRGFNQAELLTEAIAGWKSDNLLRRIRNTETQTHLTAAQRRSNVRGAFEVCGTREVLPGHVILVDDVMTTGATLDAAARCLRKAGVKQIGAITIARG